jgi:exosortase/archaeosortase family protein
MDDNTRLIRNLLAIAAIVGIAELTELDLILSAVTRPMLVTIAQVFAIDAVDRGTAVQLGNVLLPWTRDCSGVNSLVILLGACIWFGRGQRNGLPLYLRLALCVPAAMTANFLRVATIALYRHAAYPEAESAELHFLFGFMWLIPFLALLIRDFRSPGTNRWLEIVYVVVLLSLLAPVAFEPGGTIVAVCAVFWLSQGLSKTFPNSISVLAYSAWFAAALAIAWLRMESLWIPWLLVCPRFVPVRLLISPTGLIVLLGTIPVITMDATMQFVVMISLAWNMWRVFGIETDIKTPEAPERQRYIGSWNTSVLAVFAFAPFFLPSLIGTQNFAERPPAGVMTKRITPNGYQIRVAGQPADISLYWYSAFSDGRHHTVEACMRFRGITLENVSGEESVFAGDGKWYREFFIQNGHLASSYGQYLIRTLVPLSNAGVHIILQAPKSKMSASYFAMQSERIADRIFQIHAETS